MTKYKETKTKENNKNLRKGVKYRITGKKIRDLKKKIYEYLQKEFRHTTTHGLSHLVNDNTSKMEKLFWLLSFVFCVGFVVVLLSAQYWRYVTAPTVVSVEMNYFDWNISYPAITICPLFKVDRDYLGEIVNETFQKTGLNFESYLWAVSQSAMDTLEYFDLKVAKEVLPLINPKKYARVSAKMFRKLGNSLNTKPKLPISVEAAMTEMGMCHVINSNVAIYDIPKSLSSFSDLLMRVDKIGMHERLRPSKTFKKKSYNYVQVDLVFRNWNASLPYKKKNIELSVYDKDFSIEINDYAKVYKVFIHSPDEVTLRTTPSFLFDADGVMAFSLSVWSTRISEELRYHSLRLRKCRFTTEPSGSRYPVYSYNHCILECRIRMIKKLCGCVPHFYKPLSHERVCIIHELQCVLQYRREIVTLAASQETLKQFQYSKDIPTHSRDCACINSCEFDIYYKDREDYVPLPEVNKLSIGITSFPKVRIVRNIIFNFYDILLRSGGVINLCVGSSIISVMEFIVAILKIIICTIIETARILL